HCAAVIVLDGDVAARFRPTVHFAKQGNRISGIKERKPCEGQVEQLTADLVGALHIRFDESVSTCPCCLKPFDCFASGLGIAVDPCHFACRTDQFAHQLHDRAWSTADVQTCASGS